MIVRCFAYCIRAMHGEDILCQIDANGYDAHRASRFNKLGELMKSLTSLSPHSVTVNRKPSSSCFSLGGEVPFIR